MTRKSFSLLCEKSPRRPLRQQLKSKSPARASALKSVSFPIYQDTAVISRSVRIIVEHKTLRIALVEANTNVIHTEAVLLLHLFKTRTAPCIYCPKCKTFMSVKEFGAHFHVADSSSLSDEENVSEERRREKQKRELEALKRKVYNTLPCPDQGATQLTPLQTERWNTFLQLVSKFQVFGPPADDM